MSADARLQAVSNFTTKRHASVPPSLAPKNARLPGTFSVCMIGASAGIGEHIAYAYAHASASTIVISSRTRADLQSVADGIHAINADTVVDIQECDLASASSVERLASHISRTHGRLDALIPNAGYAGPVTTRMSDGQPEWVQKAFDTNAVGTYLCAHYFVPLLLSSVGGAKQFIVIGSLAGCIRRGIIANTGYTVSKMAQIRLVEYLEEQFGGEGLMSVALHPGAVDTTMARGNTPEAFVPFLTDDVDLCGAVCVWLSARREEVSWLSGRLVSAKWDMEELMTKKDRIVEKDLLKFALLTE